MSSLLVHITCGPENPTKATLAFFVAAAAVEAGMRFMSFSLAMQSSLCVSPCGTP